MPTLDFKGKQLIYAHHLTVPLQAFEVDEKKSLPSKGKKPSLDDNLIIHGDNLHALKALMPRYAGRVKCIYIDPPYNTGKEKWKYNDNVNSPMMREWLKNKSPVDGEDLERHDKWLCMMWPRLHLLRELLASDGVIFISADDNEQHRLRMMMDEIFGKENFEGHIHWRRRHNQPNDSSKMIALVAEHIISYSKDANAFKESGVGKTSITGGFSNPDNDPRGDWASKPWKSGSAQGGTKYAIITPSGKKYIEEWMGDEVTFKSLLEDKRIIFSKKGAGLPRKKYFKNEREEEGQSATNWWPHDIYGHNQSATKELSILFQKKNVLENPKPTSLIESIINVANVTAGQIILDSFAGSGTTAHAVLALNKKDGGNRKFILIQCEEYDKKRKKMINVTDKITAERVRRTIKGVSKAKNENLKKGTGGSFTYCTLGEEISIENMLKGKHLPDFETLARHLAHVSTGRVPEKIRKSRGKDGMFWEITDRLFYLIYEPNLSFLRSSESALNGQRAERIAKQVRTKNKTAVVFATHKFMGQKELTQMRIIFSQLPYSINRIA